MALQGQKTRNQLYNNVSPTLKDTSKYIDPYLLITSLKGRTEVPQEKVDIIYTECFEGQKNSISGFLDELDRIKGFTTWRVD